jgi:hypothetical protein
MMEAKVKQLQSEKQLMQEKIKKLQKVLSKLPVLEHENIELRQSLKQSIDFS